MMLACSRLVNPDVVHDSLQTDSFARPPGVSFVLVATRLRSLPAIHASFMPTRFEMDFNGLFMFFWLAPGLPDLLYSLVNGK